MTQHRSAEGQGPDFVCPQAGWEGGNGGSPQGATPGQALTSCTHLPQLHSPAGGRPSLWWPSHEGAGCSPVQSHKGLSWGLLLSSLHGGKTRGCRNPQEHLVVSRVFIFLFSPGSVNVLLEQRDHLQGRGVSSAFSLHVTSFCSVLKRGEEKGTRKLKTLN